MRFSTLSACLLFVPLASACGDRDLLAPRRGAFDSAARVNAAGAAELRLFWMPPLLKAAGPFSGTFDGSRQPTVRVVCTGATGPACPELFRADGRSFGSAKVTVDLLEQAYKSNWLAPETLVLGDGQYRLEVREGTTVLGQADLWVVRTQQEAKALPADRIALVRGAPFLIKFRLEAGSQASQLPGARDDPAVTAIALQTSPADGRNFSLGHPELPGMPMSINDATVHVSPNATVGEINTVLSEFGARIIGGVPGVPAQSAGILVLRFATASHAELDAVLVQLRQRPGILGAMPDVELSVSMAPRPNGGDAPTWEWNTLTQGGNWGLKLLNVPQLWNFDDEVLRHGTVIETGVLDDGFNAHVDVDYFDDLSDRDGDHGTHVAGTIAARHNGAGIDGISRFALLRTESTGGMAEMTTNLAEHIRDFPEERVINVSLGYNWYLRQPVVDPMNSAFAQALAYFDGASLRFALRWLELTGRSLPVIAVAAGNDSNKPGIAGDVMAEYATPFANAALRHDVAAIIVVESVDQTGSRSSFSNLGGHLAAPGESVMSTIGTNAYALKDGTSMATPHITGLVSYLYSLAPAFPRPTTTSNPMLELLQQNGTQAAGTLVSYPDAFNAALDLDRVLGGNRVLRALVDVDDGSLDGSLRVNVGGAAVLSDDLDGDGRRGDGHVDMSDFRRFRDGLLDVLSAGGFLTGVQLDGAADHPKRDLNGDGSVAGALERIWARIDFNGDRQLSRSATRALPGAMGGQSFTDLAVLQAVFDDPYYHASELPNLIESADISLDLSSCLARAAATAGSIRIVARRQGSQSNVHERSAPADQSLQVVTVPASAAGYEILIAIYDLDDVTLLARGQIAAPAAIGQDTHAIPVCDVSVRVSPTGAFLSPGGTQQFSAAVAGTSNQAVLWSATGGTISSGGLYTAGSATGTFAVTATSLEDPGVSASATITISNPQPAPTPSVGTQIVSVFSSGKPLTPVRYRARVTNLPGVTVQWSYTAVGNSYGYMPTGPVGTAVTFSPTTPVQVDQYRVDWFAELTYPVNWASALSTPGVTIAVTACYFQPNGQPLRNAQGDAICHQIVSNL